MYLGCHSQTGFGLGRVAYPDGAAYLDQPTILLEVFSAITWAINAEADVS